MSIEEQFIKDAISEAAEVREYHGFEKLPVTLEKLRVMCEGDAELLGLLQDMENYCGRYTETVLEYNRLIRENLMDDPERSKEVEAKRTIVHDATIDSINIFARNLTKAGKGVEWIQDVGKNRATYGRFAILLTLEELLKSLELTQTKQ